MDGAGRAGLWGVLPECAFAPHRHPRLPEGWGCLLVLQKWAGSLPRVMGLTDGLGLPVVWAHGCLGSLPCQIQSMPFANLLNASRPAA